MNDFDCNDNEHDKAAEAETEATEVLAQKPAAQPQRFTCFSPHCECQEKPKRDRCGDCACCVLNER